MAPEKILVQELGASEGIVMRVSCQSISKEVESLRPCACQRGTMTRHQSSPWRRANENSLSEWMPAALRGQKPAAGKKFGMQSAITQRLSDYVELNARNPRTETKAVVPDRCCMLFGRFPGSPVISCAGQNRRAVDCRDLRDAGPRVPNPDKNQARRDTQSSTVPGSGRSVFQSKAMDL